jgi:exonuclease III
MKPKLRSWNVRGLNEEENRMRIKALIRYLKADIVYLQETKLTFITRDVVRCLCGCASVDWCFLGLGRAYEGILLMCGRKVVEKLEDCVGRFTIECSFRCISDNFEWAFASVYGPNNDHDRKLLWDELVGIMSWWEKPWCIGGDFNAIRYPSDRSGDTHFSPIVREFRFHL